MREAHEKIKGEHLKKEAYLYVRQSTIRQVCENTESTERQYALRQRAKALGWSDDQILVIDKDLGRSAAAGSDREGFEKLVTEVGMGRAGIVMGLEVSRLARSSSDWHRLVEICAITGTLILDEDGLYNPNDFNDRLLLGLKGTMSEAELHMIRARLQGGILSKARRGELKVRLPVGFLYDEQDHVVLDPDSQVQGSIRMFFETFRRVGSAYFTAKRFRQEGLEFPKRMHSGPCKGEVLWVPLTQNRAVEVLHNPRYAGAFAYGRRRMTKRGDGRQDIQHVPRDQWLSLILDAHEAYISWQEYERNQERLAENHQAKPERRRCVPREGPALLQGLAVCGVCGRRMSARYHCRRGSLNPDYWCPGAAKTQAGPRCQSIPGDKVDEAIGALLLEVVNPVALEVSLAVQAELQRRFEEADALRQKQVARARYEAECARHRYMKVDPDHRLVADALEAQWDEKLRALREAEEAYERRREADRLVMDERNRERVLTLAQDFPRLWRDPRTPQRERKRMVRLLLEDVTLVKGDGIRADVRFKGGATRTLNLPRPLAAWEERQTPPEVLAEINKLLDEHTYGEVAGILNERGFVSGEGKPFHARRVRWLRRAYGLKDRYTRLQEAGLLTLQEVAAKLGLKPYKVKQLRAKGTLGVASYRLSDWGDYMYEDPEAR